MRCAKPWRQGVAEFGCGQCKPCRINRKRLWTGRLVLESLLHEHNTFLTLTYDEDHLPDDHSVSVREIQLFLKRLRKAFGKLRYYAVGEYGEATGRPHYHLALFGVQFTDLVYETKLRCYQSVMLKECWPMGSHFIGSLTPESASYIVSYVVKGMTQDNDYVRGRLQGRRPEFARMSLKPGIGGNAAERFADAYHTKGGSASLAVAGDVTPVFRFGSRRWPFGRYLLAKVRDAVGVSDEALALRLARWQEDLQIQGWEGRRERERLSAISADRAAKLYEISMSKGTV